MKIGSSVRHVAARLNGRGESARCTGRIADGPIVDRFAFANGDDRAIVRAERVRIADLYNPLHATSVHPYGRNNNYDG